MAINPPPSVNVVSLDNVSAPPSIQKPLVMRKMPHAPFTQIAWALHPLNVSHRHSRQSSVTGLCATERAGRCRDRSRNCLAYSTFEGNTHLVRTKLILRITAKQVRIITMQIPERYYIISIIISHCCCTVERNAMKMPPTHNY